MKAERGNKFEKINHAKTFNRDVKMNTATLPLPTPYSEPFRIPQFPSFGNLLKPPVIEKAQEKVVTKTIKVVFMRHGESLWNASNTFQGWTDIALSEKGEQDAIKVGQMFKQQGLKFDVVYTSMLMRATDTAKLIL